MICSKKTNLCFCSRFNLQLFFIYASLFIFDQWFQIFSFCSGPLKPWYTHFKKTIFFPLHILGLLKKAGWNYQTIRFVCAFVVFVVASQSTSITTSKVDKIPHLTTFQNRWRVTPYLISSGSNPIKNCLKKTKFVLNSLMVRNLNWG